MHDVFYMSRLKKYCQDPQHILAAKEFDLQEDLSYREEPVEILDRKIKVLSVSSVP